MTVFSNLTSKLKNAQRFNREFIIVPKTALCLNFLKLLCLEGFISGVVEMNSGKLLKVNLKYQINGTPILKEIKVLSTPGKPTYLCYSHLTKLKQGVGTIILSTPIGLLTNQDCLKNKIGGTALCYLI